MKSERKNKSLIIKGIKKSEYPLLYESIENVMKAFDTDTICVEVKKRPLNGKRINADAGWTITLKKKLIPIYCDRLRVTREMLDEMTKDEMEAIIAHEFSHFFNRDNRFDWIIEKPCSNLFCSFVLFLLALSIKNNTFLTTIIFYPINVILFCMLLFLLFSVLFLLFSVFFSTSLNSSWSEIYNWVLKVHEIRSDIEAVARTQKPEGMKSALRKLENLNMVNQNITNQIKPNIFIILKQKTERIMNDHPSKNVHPPKKKKVEYVDYMTKVKIRDTENPKRPNIFKILNHTWKELNAYKKRSSYLLKKKEFECLSDLSIYIGLTF
jgi:Zn-dependent protease with chaperone function